MDKITGSTLKVHMNAPLSAAPWNFKCSMLVPPVLQGYSKVGPIDATAWFP